jgi:uncharacterized protein (AIM24 family)
MDRVKVPNGASVDAEGVHVEVTGELVPIVQVNLEMGKSIYFEHHILLAKDPNLRIGIHPLGRGLARRLLGGLPLLLLGAEGPGHIAFSRDGVGEIVAVPLEGGREVDVLEHRFVCATGGVDYGYTRVKGLFNMLGSATGFWMDRFRGTGLVILHAYGNVVERDLGPGEAIDIEPGAWLYKDPAVSMQMHLTSLRQGLFASSQGFSMARFTGPGRIAYQSLTPMLEYQAGE